jgi:hypothetical protein
MATATDCERLGEINGEELHRLPCEVRFKLQLTSIFRFQLLLNG